MTTVFISYSRKDKAFAEKLDKALKEIYLDSWIDWEDIPPTADWWDQVQKGIENADAFLFLLSPASVTSKVCGQEIDHAAQNGKRLIPLVIREVCPDDVHSALAKLNWIFFREEDDFHTSIKKLEEGIKNDLVWVETHRRLQVRAVEWEKRKEKSVLLRGKDLHEAEEQLATAGQKDPQPTDLQRRYVLQSRKAETKSRNKLLGIGAGVIITLIALLVFAIIQLNTSRAIQFGLVSQLAFAEQRYNSAALYAVQSNLIYKNNVASSVIAKLPYQSFPLGQELIWDHPPSDWILALDWSQDGRLATVDGVGKIIIWNIVTGVPDQTLYEYGTYPYKLSWSPDGRLASLSKVAEIPGMQPTMYQITLWDPLSSGLPRPLSTGDDASSLAWSPDSQLASGHTDGSIAIWDRTTGEPTRTLKGHISSIVHLAWSQDGRLASASSDGTIIVWDFTTLQPAQVLKDSTGGISDLAWSPEGLLASASENAGIIIWDLATLSPKTVLQVDKSSFAVEIAWSSDGRLASTSLDTLIVWDLVAKKPKQKIREQPGFPITEIAWSTNGNLASASVHGDLMIWDLSIAPSVTELQTEAKSLAWSEDNRLVSTSADGKITVWNLNSGSPAQTIEANASMVAWSPDGHLASNNVDDSTVIIWDLNIGRPDKILQGHSTSVTSIDWSPDGRLASSDEAEIIIWDLNAGSPATKLRIEAKSLAWSHDNLLASVSSDGRIIIWDLQTGQPARILESYARTFAWAPDGRLASNKQIDINNPYDAIIIWDIRTGQSVQVLGEGTYVASVISIDWSHDGQLASSYSSGIVIWDLTAKSPVISLEPVSPLHTTSISKIAWSIDGRLASISIEDGESFIRIARAELVRSSPCDWIMRNMTYTEWFTYLSPYLYRRTCSNLPLPGDEAALSILERRFMTKESRAKLLLAIAVSALCVGLTTFYLQRRKSYRRNSN